MTRLAGSCSFPHVANGEKPLTQFLIDLGEDDELLERFRANPEGVLKERGLDAHPALQGELTLDDIYQAAAAENPEEDINVSVWIRIGKLPLPSPWIISSSSDEPRDDEPSGGPGGGGGGSFEPS